MYKIQFVSTKAGGMSERSNLRALNGRMESCYSENILSGFLRMSLWQPSYRKYLPTPVLKLLLSMWMQSYYGCKHRQS